MCEDEEVIFPWQLLQPEERITVVHRVNKLSTVLYDSDHDEIVTNPKFNKVKVKLVMKDARMVDSGFYSLYTGPEKTGHHDVNLIIINKGSTKLIPNTTIYKKITLEFKY